MLDWINHEWLLPFLRIGGTRSEFWGLTPKELQIDFEAYNQRIKDQQQLAWLQGAYVKMALQSSVLIAGLATKEIANKLPPYPEMPFKDEVEKQIEEQNPQIAKEKKELAQTAIFNMFKRISGNR
jgi:hypothetical protein